MLLPWVGVCRIRAQGFMGSAWESHVSLGPCDTQKSAGSQSPAYYMFSNRDCMTYAQKRSLDASQHRTSTSQKVTSKVKARLRPQPLRPLYGRGCGPYSSQSKNNPALFCLTLSTTQSGLNGNHNTSCVQAITKYHR